MVSLNILLLIFNVFKILYFLRVFTHLGRLVQLVNTCIVDMFYFAIYYISWVLTFSCVYQLIGVKFDFREYTGLSV